MPIVDLAAYREAHKKSSPAAPPTLAQAMADLWNGKDFAGELLAKGKAYDAPPTNI